MRTFKFIPIMFVFIFLITSCNFGEVTNSNEQSKTPTVPVQAASIDSCNNIGENCGELCPFSECESYLINDGEPYNKMVEMPMYDGKCNDEGGGILHCSTGRCVSNRIFIESPECVDEDGDTIADLREPEHCRKSPTNCDVCTELEIYEHPNEHPACSLETLGCPEDENHPNCVSTCIYTDDAYGGIDGNPLNFEIIIVPCGFEATEEDREIFEGYVEQISKTFAQVEPFKTYINNYRISYVWNTGKSAYKGYSVDESGAKVPDELYECHHWNGIQISHEIAQACDFTEDGNSVILDIAKESGEAASQSWNKYAVIGSGVPWCCPKNPDCCGSSDADVPFSALHEIGHLFKLGHPVAYSFDEIEQNYEDTEIQITNANLNDYYSPLSYPIGINNRLDRPCPIWDVEIDPSYYYWAQKNGQTMKCLPGYFFKLYSYTAIDDCMFKPRLFSF